MAEMAGDPVSSPWSTVEMLLAQLVDEVRNVGWMYASKNTGQTIPKPMPVRRPGISRKRGKVISLDSARKLDPRLRNVPDEEAQERLDRMTGRG